jgi:hypothetical protein
VVGVVIFDLGEANNAVGKKRDDHDDQAGGGEFGFGAEPNLANKAVDTQQGAESEQTIDDGAESICGKCMGKISVHGGGPACREAAPGAGAVEHDYAVAFGEAELGVGSVARGIRLKNDGTDKCNSEPSEEPNKLTGQSSPRG